MKSLKLITNPNVKTVFNNYPEAVRPKLDYLRQLILEVANTTESINELEETLKWGEPSYVTKIGSTLRIDWKPKAPNQYAMYFQCSSKLVTTFKVVFNNVFTYEGNRAIIFKIDDTIPETQLKQCIATALRYHKLKHLPLLGL